MNTRRARELRRTPTAAERRMWQLLHTFRTDGFHFRKQVPIGPYYADFACHHAKLVIEVDGATHSTDEERRYDAGREAFLRRDGYLVLRFWNIEVLDGPEAVFETIAKALAGRQRNRRDAAGEAHPLPIPPYKGEGELTAGRGNLTANTAKMAAPSNPLPLVGRDGEGVAAHTDFERYGLR